jgi:hypothetical protein
MNDMTTERLLIKALLNETACTSICKHGNRECGYPECKNDWCDNYADFELDIEKLKKEYDLEG